MTDAQSGDEIRFERQEVEAVGDPAVASVDAEGSELGSAPVEAPGAGDTAATAISEPAAPEAQAEPEPVDAAAPAEPSAPAGSPAAADAAAASQQPSAGALIGPIAGAFVGTFVLAKVIGRFGGDDD